MAQNWNIDPGKRDYKLANGAPEQTDSLTIPAYIRLKARRGRWMYAPNSIWGSNFYLIQKRKSTQDASFLENLAADALQPIIDDKRAKEITVSTTVVSRHNVGMQVDIVDASNEEQSITLPSI